jgi:spoIIIJ-associated protein
MPENNKEKFIEEITSLTKEFISKTGIEGNIDIIDDEEKGHCLIVSIATEQKVDDFTNRNGIGLKSAEHILRIIANRRIPEEIHRNFILDLNNYRKAKTNYLVKLAKDVASRVRESKRAEALSPMSSYERRLVHLELASYSDIATESIGEDPKRRIVIKPL